MDTTPTPGPGRPALRGDTASEHIHLRATGKRKSHYVRHAKSQGQTLADWAFQTLDAASNYKDPIPAFPGLQIKEMPMPPGILGIITSPDDPSKTVIIKE